MLHFLINIKKSIFQPRKYSFIRRELESAENNLKKFPQVQKDQIGNQFKFFWRPPGVDLADQSPVCNSSFLFLQPPLPYPPMQKLKILALSHKNNFNSKGRGEFSIDKLVDLEFLSGRRKVTDCSSFKDSHSMRCFFSRLWGPFIRVTKLRKP